MEPVVDYEFHLEPDHIQWPHREDFGWWCLSHNLDVVGALVAARKLGWEAGFSSGRVISGFNEH